MTTNQLIKELQNAVLRHPEFGESKVYVTATFINEDISQTFQVEQTGIAFGNNCVQILGKNRPHRKITANHKLFT